MYLWLETTFGTGQKWSLRPLLDSPKGGLDIGILLYIESRYLWKRNILPIEWLQSEQLKSG